VTRVAAVAAAAIVAATLIAAAPSGRAAAAVDGAPLFNQSCALCHQAGGVGSPGLAPPLIDAQLWGRLGARASEYVAGVMLVGFSGTIEVGGTTFTGLVMPPQDRMSDEELAAIGSYVLSTLNGVHVELMAAEVAKLRAAPPTHAQLRALRRGSPAAERSAAVNYVLHCSGCHGMDGSGHESAGIPDFRAAVGAFAMDPEGRTYLLHVPGIVNASMTDAEIAGVLNYVMDRWSAEKGRFARFTAEEAGERRAHKVSDVVALRRQIAARLNAEGIRTAAYPWP